MLPIIAQAGYKDTKPDPDYPVDNKLRQDWNNYLDWLSKKGLKGDSSLDKGGYGFQVLEQYRKENPLTTLTKESIPVIQKEFGNYRNYVLGKIKAKDPSYQFAPGTDEKNFLKDLSIVDGVPGQRTTNFKFPDNYLKSFHNGVLSKVENKGFVHIPPILSNQPK